MIDQQNVFDQPVKSNFITRDNTRKTAIGQGDDYTTVCLLDYTYFNNYYQMMAIDLRRHKKISFTANLIRKNA